MTKLATRIDDDNYQISQWDLQWLLCCTRDILREDVIASECHPNSQNLVKANLKRVETMLEEIEEGEEEEEDSSIFYGTI
jgi:hypothetical protein